MKISKKKKSVPKKKTKLFKKKHWSIDYYCLLLRCKKLSVKNTGKVQPFLTRLGSADASQVLTVSLICTTIIPVFHSGFVLWVGEEGVSAKHQL